MQKLRQPTTNMKIPHEYPKNQFRSQYVKSQLSQDHQVTK